jgi:hypothetical protein
MVFLFVLSGAYAVTLLAFHNRWLTPPSPFATHLISLSEKVCSLADFF